MFINPYLAVDIETYGTDPRRGAVLLCTSWATEESPIVQVVPGVPTEVLDRLADPTCTIISHSKYEPIWFRRAGYEVTPPYHDTMVMAHLLNENTKLTLEACAEIYLNLEMDKRLERKDKKVWFRADNDERLELHDAWKKYRDQVMHYCRRDTEAEQQLYFNLCERMKQAGWWDEFVSPRGHAKFTEVLVDMECMGLPINEAEASALKAELAIKVIEQEKSLVTDLGYEINFGSPLQLRTVLFSKMWEQQVKLPITKEQRDCLRSRCEHPDGPASHENTDHVATEVEAARKEAEHFILPSKYEVKKIGTKFVYVGVMQKGLGIEPKVKTDTGLWSTSTPVLMTYHGGNEVVSDLIAYRKTDKVLGTYLNAYPEYTYKGRLYGRFSQTGTVSGRLSHSQPNLGNQPVRPPLGPAIRGLFQGRLIIGDHGQLENRFMAHFSQDPVLMDVYRKGLDIHVVTAEYVFGHKVEKGDEERDIAKVFGYAMGYGAGARTLATIMALNGFWTPLDRVQEYLDELENLYSGFFGWKRHVIADAKRNGYVKTIGGRFRRLRYAYDDKHFRVRNKADRQAVNGMIQGSAADVLRMNMIDTRGAYPNLPLLNQIHDELIWEHAGHVSPSNLLADLQHICENPGFNLTVPLKFEPQFCESWADKGSGMLELPDEDDE